MTFSFPGGSRVNGQVGPFTIPTDQPPHATAPSPFDLFLASVGACAAYYVLSFCGQRGISTDGIQISQRNETGPAGLVRDIRIRIELPEVFPDEYRAAVLRAAAQCTVKKHLEHPPTIIVENVSTSGVALQGV